MNITDKQAQALRGELDLEGWNAEGMGLWQAGLVSIDPLAEFVGAPTAFNLTDQGRDLAMRLRSKEASQ